MQITKGKINKAQKICCYGPEGIGKTTFASQFPDPLFIDTEGSTNNIDVARLQKPSSWVMLLSQIDFVKKNKPCKTLVIDTIDWAERLCVDYVCEKGKKDSITKFGYGEGWIQLEEEFGRFLNKLSDLIDVDINVVLTAHSKITKFEQPDEFGAYDRWEMKLGNKTTAKTSSLAKEWADMLLFSTYKTVSVATDDKGTKFKGQGKKRVMYTSHHPAWDAKNRHGLPEELPFDFSQIAHCIPGAVDTSTTTTAAPTSPPPTTQSIPTGFSPSSPAPGDGNPFTEPSGKEEFVPGSQQPHEQLKLIPEPQPQKEPTREPPATHYEFPPGIPKELLDLMKINRVSPEEIQSVVAKKGYYPIQTSIDKYDPDFIKGVLVGAWPQVLKIITDDRGEDVPF